MTRVKHSKVNKMGLARSSHWPAPIVFPFVFTPFLYRTPLNLHPHTQHHPRLMPAPRPLPSYHHLPPPSMEREKKYVIPTYPLPPDAEPRQLRLGLGRGDGVDGLLQLLLLVRGLRDPEAHLLVAVCFWMGVVVVRRVMSRVDG
jgi:hypothetical protein